MKIRKILLLTVMIMLAMSMNTFASYKDKDPIFMGKILEVTNNEKDNNILVKAKGYIRACSVYEEEIILLINKDTEIISDSCNELVGNVEKICVNDTIYAKLDKAMTKSIPPQVSAKSIQVTKAIN